MGEGWQGGWEGPCLHQEQSGLPAQAPIGWALCQGQRGAERSVPLTPASGISQLSMLLRSKTTTNLLLSLYDTQSQLGAVAVITRRKPAGGYAALVIVSYSPDSCSTSATRVPPETRTCCHGSCFPHLLGRARSKPL